MSGWKGFTDEMIAEAKAVSDEVQRRARQERGELEPALTAEEWRDIAQQAGLRDEYVIGIDDLDITFGRCNVYPPGYNPDDPASEPKSVMGIKLEDGGTPAQVYTPDQLSTVIALANHALPEGHPLKIGKSDITKLRNAAGYFDPHGYPGAQMHEVIAKLAALLPPDA